VVAKAPFEEEIFYMQTHDLPHPANLRFIPASGIERTETMKLSNSEVSTSVEGLAHTNVTSAMYPNYGAVQVVVNDVAISMRLQSGLYSAN
jgi:hypothetical protein